MRFIPKTHKLEGEDLMLASNPEKRQLFAEDLNEQSAKAHFKMLPWALVLITPTFIWFRR